MVSSVSSTDSLSINQMLKRLDLDEDGGVSESELVAQRSDATSASRAAQIFQDVDWNQDGRLTEGELSATYQLISSQTLTTLLESQSVDGATISTYREDLAENPEDAFTELDQDGDGQLTEGEFVAARQAGTATKATTLWNQIVSNSMSPSDSTGLTQEQFAAGVAGTAEQAATEDTLAARSKTVNNIKDMALHSIDLGTTNASDLFASVDGNRDGYVTKADFLAGVPTSVSATQANSLWSRIVANSGSTDGSGALTEDQFSTGFYSVRTASVDATTDSLSEDAIAEMVSLIRTYGSSSASSNTSTSNAIDDVSLDDPYAAFQAIDGNSDGLISQNDFLNSMSSLSASQANTLWNNIVAHSGAESVSSLTEDQFVTGYLDRNTPLDSESSTTSSSTATLSSLVLELRDAIPRMYDLGTSNNSDIFAILDGDGDGSVSYTDFLSARPSSVSADQASATWQAIVANSGSSDTPDALSENQFVTGLENIWGSSLSSSDANRLTALLDTIDGKTTSVLRSSSNLSDSFSLIDSDHNGLISRDDLVSARNASSTEEQANALWAQIVLNAGSDGIDSPMTESQFIAGYEATQLSSLNDETAARLTEYLRQLQSGDLTASDAESSASSASSDATDAVSFDMTAYNPSDLFATADDDQDGFITQDDFVASLSLNQADARVLWQHISGNSGNMDTYAVLNESQFVTGYNNTSATTMANPSSYATVKQLQSFVDTLRSLAPQVFDSSTVDAESLFDEMDGDRDDLVMRDDFLNNRPSALSEDSASQFWDLIASNAGSLNNGEILTREQFLTGYGASNAADLEAANNSLMDRLDQVIGGLISRTDGTISLQSTEVQGMSDQIDQNVDTVLSRDEVLAALRNEVGFADAMYPNSDNSAYIVQQMVNAMFAYQGLA